LLTNESGQNFTGSSSAIDTSVPSSSLRLDPEGIRVGSTGQLYVSDEYGPYVYQVNQNGQRVSTLAVPSKFTIDHPNADGTLELPPNNASGRQSNRGMEGLAITPSGNKLYGIMQSPLIQDGGLNAANSRVGLNTRILEMTVGSTLTREFLYPLSAASNGISEILAVNDSQFLVSERDGNAGARRGSSNCSLSIFSALRISVTSGPRLSMASPPPAFLQALRRSRKPRYWIS